MPGFVCLFDCLFVCLFVFFCFFFSFIFSTLSTFSMASGSQSNKISAWKFTRPQKIYSSELLWTFWWRGYKTRHSQLSWDTRMITIGYCCCCCFSMPVFLHPISEFLREKLGYPAWPKFSSSLLRVTWHKARGCFASVSLLAMHKALRN